MIDHRLECALGVHDYSYKEGVVGAITKLLCKHCKRAGVFSNSEVPQNGIYFELDAQNRIIHTWNILYETWIKFDKNGKATWVTKTFRTGEITTNNHRKK